MSSPENGSNREKRSSVRYVEVGHDSVGQRLDNFLLKELKGAPKSLIYRILRKGEVRVNKKRAKPLQKLRLGDSIRIPPVRLPEPGAMTSPSEGLKQLIRDSVIYEDEQLIVVNKPSGLAVHGGSGLSSGLIESMRDMEFGRGYLELVHRLDRETSGCLMLAKKRSVLTALHEIIRSGDIRKTYQTLVYGSWPKAVKTVDAPLKKNTLSSGERVVKVSSEGKASVTHFQILQVFNNATLLEVDLDTGRTHQIRVHAQLTGHPIMGDGKYGSKETSDYCKKIGLKRLFLHAAGLEFVHPATGEKISAVAAMPQDLQNVLEGLDC